MTDDAVITNDPPGEFVCPECGRDFKMAGHLASHRKHKHDVTPIGPSDPSKRKKRAPTSGSLRGQIKDAVLMTSAVVSITDPRIYGAVEATVDEFATAWDNVAKTSPTARRYIEGLLVGGVWISALGATVVMMVTVAAVTDKLPPSLYPLGYFCVNRAGLKVVPPEEPPEAAVPA